MVWKPRGMAKMRLAMRAVVFSASLLTLMLAASVQGQEIDTVFQVSSTVNPTFNRYGWTDTCNT